MVYSFTFIIACNTDRLLLLFATNYLLHQRCTEIKEEAACDDDDRNAIPTLLSDSLLLYFYFVAPKFKKLGIFKY